MEENKLSPDERQRLIESKKQRFAKMNIPTPVAPVIPQKSVNVKDPKMLNRIREIQGGKLKQEFRAFENKSQNTNAGHVDLPLPAKKQQPGRQQQNAATKKEIPKLEEFSAKPDPFLDGIKDLFSDKPSSSNYGRPSQIDDGGSSFTNQFRNKLHNRLNEKVQTQGQLQNEDYVSHQVPALQSGMIVLNEEDLKKKIISIARPIAKQVATEIIKQVLNEYMDNFKKPSAPVKPIVSETAKNIVSSEILPNNKIRINGKIYNISADK